MQRFKKKSVCQCGLWMDVSSVPLVRDNNKLFNIIYGCISNMRRDNKQHIFRKCIFGSLPWWWKIKTADKPFQPIHQCKLWWYRPTWRSQWKAGVLLLGLVLALLRVTVAAFYLGNEDHVGTAKLRGRRLHCKGQSVHTTKIHGRKKHEPKKQQTTLLIAFL